MGGSGIGQHWQTIAATSGNSAYPTYTAGGGGAGASGYPISFGEADAHFTPDDAGIRAGEIIAYRAWKLVGCRLGSVYVSHVWSPKQTEFAHNIKDMWGCGIHAYKDLDHAMNEYGDGYWACNGWVVYGEVALWGTVFEHERGYRAEFARVKRLYQITTKLRFRDRLPLSKLKRLRRIYGV